MRDPGLIRGWHAHVYFDGPAARAAAGLLREGIAAAFPEARLGRWHEVPVGPHTRAMYQVAFEVALFSRLVPFLALNRGALAVLIHPETDSARADHIDHAMWLGEVLAVDASKLPD